MSIVVISLALAAAVGIAAFLDRLREEWRRQDEVALDTLGADKVHPRILRRAKYRFACVSCRRPAEVPLADVQGEDLAAPRRCPSCTPATLTRSPR